MSPETIESLEADPQVRLAMNRALAARSADPTRLIYPASEAELAKAFPIIEPAEQQDMDTAMHAASRPAAPGTEPHPDELAVWIQFTRLLPLTRLLGPAAVNGDPNHAPLIWSKARMFLAGAGFDANAVLAPIAAGTYPICDLDAAETEAEWIDALHKAHTACGWSSVLGRAPWARIVNAVPVADAHDPPQDWMFPVALLHLLKHARTRAMSDALIVCYRGTAAEVKGEAGNVPGHWGQAQTRLLKALGCRVGTPSGTAHPLTKAMQWILSAITLDKLLPQTPLPELPMAVLAGPWSSCDPDPAHNEGFFQTGCRLNGVWLAAGGRVQPYTGDAADAIAAAWNVRNPGEFKLAREALTAAMPATYPTSWPAETFLDAFPNLMLDWATDKDAAKVMLELPWFAAQLRRPGQPLAAEFPMVAFLPDEPTPDGSTNQGKSKAASVYVRVMAPSAPCIIAPDTGSAPDARAVVDMIVTHGTVALDEWALPTARANPLNHQNLQTLCTGGAVAVGRVMENAGHLTLRQSLVASAKALDFPPDMVNRSIVWTMRTFNQAELSRGHIKRAVESGALALQLRLAVLSCCEAHDLPAKAASLTYAAGALRFDGHMALAKMLYELRTGRPDNGAIDKTLAEMRSRFARHTQDADASGVLAQLETGSLAKIRASNLFAGMSDEQMKQTVAMLESMQNSRELRVGPWNIPRHLLDAVRAARGFASLQAMLPSISGARMRATDRVIIQALGSDLKQVLQPGHSMRVPDTDYQLERGTDSSGYLRVRLSQIQSAQPNGSVVAP